MSPKQLCEQYLSALNEGSIGRVLAVFERDAVVMSPLYGSMPVARFYADLFADTNRSETRLIRLFKSVPDASSVALQFHYRWTLKSGKVVEFDCVDVFELNAERSKFSSIKIIYDTAPIRADFAAAHGGAASLR